MPDAAGNRPFDVAQMRTKIRAIGTEITPDNLGAAMKLYAPLHGAEPYAGVKLTRDIKYGPDERNRLDLFLPAAGGKDLPVLIYLHGGGFVGGDKKSPAFPYYDNVMLWAVRNGMAGVNMTYRLAPAHKWPSGNEDIANAIRWIQKHAAAHGMNPSRIFLMGQSAGASHVAQYIAHPQYHPEGGHGLAGGLLISGIYEPNNKAYFGEDKEKWPSMSAMPGLVATDLPLLVTVAENDPPLFEANAMALQNALYQRDKRIPWFQRMWGHNHISAMLHVGLEPQDQLGDLIRDFVATH
ncbi:MAG TPA: alpha/beta hydrolase [Stellaceae bacterium]